MSKPMSDGAPVSLSLPATTSATLKERLYALIVEYGLHEILDRLEEIVHEEAAISKFTNFGKCRQLNQMGAALEQARSEALKIAHHEWE